MRRGEEKGGPRSSWRNNLLVYLLIATTLLVTQPTASFFSLYQRDLGFSMTYVGIIAAAAAMFDLLGRFGAGVLSDRKGRKKPLLFLVLGSVLYPFLLIYARSATDVLLVSVLHAVINAAFWTVIVAYLYDTNPKNSGGQVYGRSLMAVFAVNLISPSLGGLVVGTLGFGWLFTLSCYFAVIPLIIVFFLKNPVLTHQRLSVRGEAEHILERPGFVKVWAVMLVVAFSSSFISTFFPIYLKEVIGLSYQEVGLFFSAGTVLLFLAQPVFGWVADRFRSRVVIPGNLLLMSVGLFLLSVVSSVWAVFLSKTLVPIGIFGSRVKGASNVAKMTLREEHALADALFKSSSGIGWAVMNTISPVLIASIGFAGVFRALALFTALTGAWFFFSYNKRGRDEGSRSDLKRHHAFTLSDTSPLEHHGLVARKRRR